MSIMKFRNKKIQSDGRIKIPDPILEDMGLNIGDKVLINYVKYPKNNKKFIKKIQIEKCD